MPTYPFTEEDMQQAASEWGCNCGPSALAFALQIPLDKVRGSIFGFNERRYTSPTMMKQGLGWFGKPYLVVSKPTKYKMFDAKMTLVRIQWTGPWTAKGANPKWAYRQTHWIATWEERGVPLIFDCNGGIQGIETWENQTVPAIIATIDRADGEWFPTHIWRLINN